MRLPPTRNHRQLAMLINRGGWFDSLGRSVEAGVTKSRVSTDTKLAGTRLRLAGKGRASLRLEIWLVNRVGLVADHWGHNPARLYQHESGETYRRHSEAREWVEKNLHRARRR